MTESIPQAVSDPVGDPFLGSFGVAPPNDCFVSFSGSLTPDLTPWQQLLVWIEFIGVWAFASMFILKRSQSAQGGVGKDDSENMEALSGRTRAD